MTNLPEQELNNVVRKHAEEDFADELAALVEEDSGYKPTAWKLSPKMVKLFILGGKTPNGKEISQKYFGPERLIDLAIATLTTDRALLLYGMPGTGKSWLSELLAAAISGKSTLLIQGTAGTEESALRYGWNYAKLIGGGYTRDALVESPTLRGMREGSVVRVEELTRMPGDVQDALITILSERTTPIPELLTEIQAQKGFNVIATANDRDRGVNELSKALERRFSFVVLPPPGDLEEEVKIVATRVEKLGRALEAPPVDAAIDEIRRVVTIFRELRGGQTVDGKTALKQPSSTLSPGEAISVVNSGIAMAGYFGTGKLRAEDIASSVVGAVVKEETDKTVWSEYVDAIVKKRWADMYKAFKELE
ncbi:MAG: AAA family ATPase [Thermoguttaceae bacterium]|nr:AAA family ATPase [Thermoguttaceae bacterium]